MSDWPAELDALIAAPEHHKLLMENDHVRVLETKIAPGERTAVHTHKNSATNYILSWDHGIRRDAAGEIIFDTEKEGVWLEPGHVSWQAPPRPALISERRHKSDPPDQRGDQESHGLTRRIVLEVLSLRASSVKPAQSVGRRGTQAHTRLA